MQGEAIRLATLYWLPCGKDVLKKPAKGKTRKSTLELASQQTTQQERRRCEDVSSIREVPDNQEVYADPNLDESVIIELLELEQNVADAESAVWFLHDLSHEQDAGQTLVVEDVKALTSGDTPLLGSQFVVNAAVGRMAVSKGNQGAEAQNLLRVYLANIRLRNLNTDVLVTVYEPLLISEQSESARVLGAGATISAEDAGVMPASEIFRLVLATFQIHDWSLFGH